MILITVLLSSSGLLFGCQNLYAKMKLELSVEEIVLYLDNTLETEEPVEEPVDGEEETPIGENMFTATIKNLPKNVSNKLIINQTIPGIVSVVEVERREDQKENETVFSVTPLKAGSTTLTIKTQEGNKQVSIPVLVIEEITALELNEAYKPMVVVNETTIINTAKALKFTPATTNQKDVVYSLVEENANIELTEAGAIKVLQKTTDFITVRATSVDNETLFTDILIRVIEPILQDKIELQINGGPVNGVVLSNNVISQSQAQYNVVVKDNAEPIDVTLTVNTRMQLDIEKLTNTTFLLRSIELGNAIITAKISVEGYPEYVVEKNFPVSILEYPRYVSINSIEGNFVTEVYDRYLSALGTPFTLRVGAIGAYDKRIKLMMTEEERNLVEIRYSDGRLVNMESDILPNNVTIYVKAVANEEGLVGAQANLEIYSYITMEQETKVSSTLTMNLKKGAEDLNLVEPNNARLSLEEGQETTIIFEALPLESSLGTVTLTSNNAGIVEFIKLSATSYKVKGLKPGNTRLTLMSSNGISKNIEVEVYKLLQDFTLNMVSPAENYNVGYLQKETTPENHQTLSNVTIAIGTGVNLQVIKYPSNANMVSISYISSNINVASISPSGYIVAKALGNTTITVRVGKLNATTSGQSELVYIERSFNLMVYLPIINTQLNHYQYELLDHNTLGYYEKHLSRLQLLLNINPINATFNQSSVVWSVTSNYATISSSGLLQVSLPAEINSANITVTATIQEYNRYYTQKSVIRVTKPVKVTGINILNVQKELYFDAREGLGNNAKESVTLNAMVYPVNASNKTLKYIYIQNATDTNIEPVVKILDGKITPNRPGSATIHVVAEDSYISNTEYTTYASFKVRVADGESDETAIAIRSAQDLFNINTLEGLSLHYVLTETIDLTGLTINPIGIIDGANVGFSGVIRGNYNPTGTFEVENQIIGANFVVSKTDRNNFIGLFSQLSGGVIKNLTYKVNLFDVTLSSNSSGSVGHVGALVGRVNSGTIENVKVQLLNSKIELANRDNFVGGIVGYAEESSNIINSKVWGSLVVNRRQATLSSEPLIYVGGMVGYNKGQISGNADVTSESVIENIASYHSNLVITTANMQNANSSFGGVAGYNNGSIYQVSSNSSVSALNNVGGLIGHNIGTVSNVIATGFVVGTSNVGGLIGTSSGTVSNAIVLILDKFALSQTVAPQIRGLNNVGGLIGEARATSTISYSYVRSFYTRAIDYNLYYGDIYITIPQNYVNTISVGGLIGNSLDANLNAVYAHLNMVVNDVNATNATVYAGGIVGKNQGTLFIENAYTKGNLNIGGNAIVGGTLGYAETATTNINKTYTTLNITGTTIGGVVGQILTTANIQSSLYINTIAVTNFEGVPLDLVGLRDQTTYQNYGFGLASLGGAPFDIDANFNDGTAFILYSNNAKMLIQAPTDLEVVVNDGITNANQIKNGHFKISDKKAVVYYYENPQGNLNYYSIDNTLGEFGSPIIQKQFTPSNINIGLATYVVSDTSIARILENGVLEVLKEGVVTITIYSMLDKNVFDTFEVAIIKPITGFNLYHENLTTNTLELLTTNPFIMKKNNLKRLYPTLNAQIDGVNYSSNKFTYLRYSTLEQAGVGLDVANFNWTNESGVYTYNLLANNAQVLRANYATYYNNEVMSYALSVAPAINVVFGDGTYSLTLDFLKTDFSVKVIEGSTKLELSSYEANISLKDIYVIDVMLETDIPLGNTEPNTSVIDVASVVRVVNAEQGVVLAENELIITKNSKVINGNSVLENYKIELANPFNSLYKTTQKYVITFASYDKSSAGVKLEGELPTLTTELKLTIIPQEAFRIDMNYYSANEIFEYQNNVYYNPNELPSTSITAGKIGLLKLNIYPNYANVDYIDLTYTASERYTLSLEQVAFVNETIEGVTTLGYTAIHPQSELIPNGIRLRLISNRLGENNFNYDGNIYVRVLIASAVSTSTQFNLTATVNYISESGVLTKGLTKIKTLSVQPASQVEVSYNGLKDTAYLPIGVEKNIVISVSKLEVKQISEIKITLEPFEAQNLVEISFVTSYQNGFIMDYVYKFKIKYDVNFDFTKNITVKAMIQKTINNNIEQYKSNTLTITPTLFTIDSIYVNKVDAQTKQFVAAFGGIYALDIKLNATYYENAVNVNDIKAQIAALELAFTKKIALSADQNKVSSWYRRVGIVDSIIQAEQSYITYEMIATANGVSIKPRRVHTGDIIVAKVQFKYNQNPSYNGVPEPYFDNLTQTPVGIDNLARITMEYVFTTQIYLRAGEDNPIPVYDETGLKEMQEGASYILMNDIILGEFQPFAPIKTAIKSLDGNSYSITIKNFMIDQAGAQNLPTIKHFGLFETLSSGTNIKNLTVVLNNLEIDATLYKEVYFGAIAGMNNGATIYNSVATSNVGPVNTGVKIILSSVINNQSTIAQIGGLVGQNSGYIINSRSYLKMEANKGYMGGLVATNSGVIASSFYKDGVIKNTSQTKLNSVVGGLVAYNTTSGKIRYSYVEGNFEELERIDNVVTGRILGGGLEFSGDLAGFVYENSGNISNSYANIKITSQSRSAGFVFNNKGTITNAYSMSRVAYNVAAHTPFTGTNEQGTPYTGTMNNVFYLAGSFAVSPREAARAITKPNWQLSSSFTNFLFSGVEGANYGVWNMSYIEDMKYPTLVSANHIAESKQELSSQETNEETGEITYHYNYVIENLGQPNEKNYTIGSYLNPLTIQNSNQFNAVLTEQSYYNNQLFNQNVRIIKDFNFNTAQVVETSTIKFAGVLDGNGMTIENISVVSTNQTTGNMIGLFGSITNNNAEIGVVKNLNLKYNEVFANNKVYVGALAGVINNGIVYNVTINSPTTVVQGKNLVGGIAGKVIGNSHLVNIEVSISANASYRQTVNTNIAYDIYNNISSIDDPNSNDNVLAYAGAIAGVVDVTSSGKIENIKVFGNSSIIAETVGGAFGLIGANTTANNVTVEIVKSQFLRTTKVVGGVVGENRGTLLNATIRHTTTVQTIIDATMKNGNADANQNTTLFAGIGQVAGGLVGFNNGGTIDKSIAKVDVRNANIQIAGGLVGRSVGGTITNSYTNGSVLAQKVVGGLIGAVTDRTLLAAESDTGLIKYSYIDVLATGNTKINRVYAYNKWLSMDYTMLTQGSASDKIVIGGLVGVIQSQIGIELTEGGIKANNIYVNSLYDPSNFTSPANWRLISEYGFKSQSLSIVYAESNQLSDLSGNTGKKVKDLEGDENDVYVDYPAVNDTNTLSIGKKTFEIVSFFPTI